MWFLPLVPFPILIWRGHRLIPAIIVFTSANVGLASLQNAEIVFSPGPLVIIAIWDGVVGLLAGLLGRAKADGVFIDEGETFLLLETLEMSVL